MAQDLRDLFKNEPKDSQLKMGEGHEARFITKLDEALPKDTSITKRFSIFYIAASILVLIGLSFGAYQFFNEAESIRTEIVNNQDPSNEQELRSLGDISPDFKKLEDYYLANINLELSKVKLTPDNKELFDGYVVRLAELNEEYKRLSVELTENGPNELTVSALIDNLKLRLNLLYRLKEQLKELSTSEEAQTT
ncbi:hypothetical protein SAMN04515667_2780 [Formosa sp. Hel1_31_208]|uniref:hypothetical protein n=1 Tax=Formosa sp. Hel1_31_208 TaxID=1798225 RepID=UPI00087A8366|nr:hypothetical protein [Formosa sp. Hel1_31_208]SDS70316.1 hypothetical protein SAMN04515667_2780 [Formosa sp. Hel1_31_208]